MSRPAFRPVLLLVAVAAILAACSSSAVSPVPLSTTSPGLASNAPASLIPPSAIPSVPPLASPTPAPSPSQGAALPSPVGSVAPSSGPIPAVDLARLLESAMPGLDSYRAAFTVGGVLRLSTVIVTHPVLSKSAIVFAPDGTTVKTRVVVIGPRTWTASGTSGSFRLLPTATAAAMLKAFDLSPLLRSFLGLDWTTLAANQGIETKNGVSAHHLRIDSASALGKASSMPAGAAINVWVADAGYVVAWEMSGFPKASELSIEISGFNDPANVVTAPAP